MKIQNLQFENMTFRKPWIMRWKLGRTKNRRIINSILPRVLLFTGWHYASFIITDYIIQQQKMDGNKNRIMLSLLLQAWIRYCEISFLIYSRCDTYSTKTMVEIKLFDKLLQKMKAAAIVLIMKISNAIKMCEIFNEKCKQIKSYP